jgi:hypothetical protein
MEVRTLLDAAAAAAEAKSAGFFRDHISPAYADSAGRTRDDLLRRVRGYFLINGDVRVVTRDVSVQLDGDAYANVVLQVALIGDRRGAAGALGLDAQLHRVELELARDGATWQLIGASWR